jgi:hypothetical protein
MIGGRVMLWIIDANYVGEYKIKITFNNGVKKIIDLKHHLNGKIFEPLNDVDKFKKFHLSDWTIEWENGADMAPEFLWTL